MKIYNRLINNTLNRLNDPAKNKILAVLGARQIGKTTALMDFASNWRGKIVKYLGDKLEDALLWRGRFDDVRHNIEMGLGESLGKLNGPCLLIFDEIQKIPEAFNNLKILHDEFKNKIKIAVSGSSSLRLMHRTTESLGGRVEIATMYPLSFGEVLSDIPQPVWLKKSVADYDFIKEDLIKKAVIAPVAERSLQRVLSFGLFPEAYQLEDLEEVKLLYQNYHQTYIEKDVRDLKEIGNILDFDLVWKIVHRQTGQLLNYTNIAQETGLAFNTVKKYISVLNASYNIITLLTFTKNIRQRLVKSSKIFSLDTGFFNHCLGIYNADTLVSSGLIGRAFESIMVTEFFKQERFFLIEAEPYFFRTSAGAEVDLVIERGLDLFAYEFKYGDKITPSDFNGIKSLDRVTDNRLRAGFVVSRQSYPEKFGEKFFAVPWWFFCI